MKAQKILEEKELQRKQGLLAQKILEDAFNSDIKPLVDLLNLTQIQNRKLIEQKSKGNNMKKR